MDNYFRYAQNSRSISRPLSGAEGSAYDFEMSDGRNLTNRFQMKQIRFERFVLIC